MVPLTDSHCQIPLFRNQDNGKEILGSLLFVLPAHNPCWNQGRQRQLKGTPSDRDQPCGTITSQR